MPAPCSNVSTMTCHQCAPPPGNMTLVRGCCTDAGDVESNPLLTVLCLDCDTLYFSDVLSMFRSAPNGKGMCVYFIDKGTAALYSYLRLDAAGEVAQVHEKSAVSELANIGAWDGKSNRYPPEEASGPDRRPDVCRACWTAVRYNYYKPNASWGKVKF